MATYSQSISGLNQTLFEPKVLTINDAQATTGAQTLAMQQGLWFLAKKPDGSQGYFVIDAERSLPGQTPILRAVSP